MCAHHTRQLLAIRDQILASLQAGSASLSYLDHHDEYFDPVLLQNALYAGHRLSYPLKSETKNLNEKAIRNPYSL
jgi:hypothetical protein